MLACADIPYGSSGKYCPACLSDGHLVLGKPEIAAKVRKRSFWADHFLNLLH